MKYTTFDPKYSPRSYSLAAFKIIESEHVREQFRFPRTKKRRIRKKWAKRPENFRPMRGFLEDKAAGIFYIHPQTMRLLEQQLAREAIRHHEEQILEQLFKPTA